MKKVQPTNLPASVHQRLLNLSRQRGEDFNVTLTRYGLERLLHRLSQSPHADRFVLKGALLFSVWTGRLYRPTRDLDLLGYGEWSQDGLSQVFREICVADVEPDGLTFDPDSVRVMEIREDQEYGGQRVQLMARLQNARVSLQIDIGFGDVVTPVAERIDYPTLLGHSALRLRAYPRETVVAEKFQAMVALGMINSRMKDFYDIWMMSRELQFDGKKLAKAIQATFERRRTEIPASVPRALTAEFALERDKAIQWNAFLSRSWLDVGGTALAGVVEDLNGFLMPVVVAIGSVEEFRQNWPAGGPWTET